MEIVEKIYDKDKEVRSNESYNLRMEREKLGIYLTDKLKALSKSQDNSFGSPLHLTIEAVGEWRIEDGVYFLLQKIDYIINSSTVPSFKILPHYAYYPAADALRKIGGIQVRKAVVERLTKETNPDTVRICVWVLYEGYGEDVAGFLLDNEANKTQNIEIKERLLKAKEILKDGPAILKRPEEKIK